MTRSYSRQYSAVQNCMKRRLGSDELGLRSSSWAETLDGKRSVMSGKEARAIAEIRQAQRDDAQLCGAIHAETREEGLEKLRAREERDAEHRPGRVGQVRKKRDICAGKPFAAKDPKGKEFWDEFIPSLTKEKAEKLYRQWYVEHRGTEWPAWARRVMSRIEARSLVVEAA